MYTGIELKVENSLSNAVDQYKVLKKVLKKANPNKPVKDLFKNGILGLVTSKEIELIQFMDHDLKSIESQIEKYKAGKKSKFDNISSYLIAENTLDAEQLSRNFFPDNKEYDVFLSHSHLNEDFAIVLAIALEKLGLKVFIDSCVWGYAGDLQKEIDTKYCKLEGTYDFDTRQYYGYDYASTIQSSAHVNMILNFALQRMIDKSELLLFLNTNESVPLKGYLSSANKTYSPWVASELLFSSLVRERTPIRFSSKSEVLYKSRNRTSESLESVKIAHNASLSHLHSIGLSDFIQFVLSNINDHTINGHDFLDALYANYAIAGRL